MNDEIKNYEIVRIKHFAVFSALVLSMLSLILFVYSFLFVPLFIGVIVAYILYPLVQYYYSRNVSRGIIVSIIMFIFLCTTIVLALNLAPILYHQFMTLVSVIPESVSSLFSYWVPLAQNFVDDLGMGDRIDILESIKSLNILNELSNYMQTGMGQVLQTVQSLLGNVLYAILAPIVTFAILIEYPRVAAYLNKLVPLDLRAPVLIGLERINLTLRTVIKRQAFVALILSVLYAVGFSIVNAIWGLQSAITIGLIAGVFRFIPYVDIVVALILATIAVMANYQGIYQIVAIVVVIITVQAIDGVFITPRVIGERVGLNPLIVIISILVFSNWFGFWGVLLCIPVLAVIKTIWQMVIPFYLSSSFYKPKWFL